MDSTRRGFVAAVGTAAVAGCTGPASDGAQTGEPTATERPTERDGTTGDGRGDSRAYAAVAESVSESVVRVQMYDGGGRAGQGSGFLHRGHVVTNEHVVFGGDAVELQYPDESWHDAEVVGTDPYSDLAVITPGRDLAGNDAPAQLELVEDTPPIGTEVLAFGAPFGLGGSVSQGIVSGRNRSLPAPNNFQIADVVQTDAAVNPGNSGGPLVTLEEEVVGVVTATQGENVGLAVSAPLADRVVPALIEDGTYEHSYIGVQVSPVTPTIAEENDLDSTRGVYITDVVPDGPSAGVLEGATDSEIVGGQQIPLGGDVVRGLDDTEIVSNEDLSRFLALQTSPGETIRARVYRDGEMVTETITVGTRPPPR